MLRYIMVMIITQLSTHPNKINAICSIRILSYQTKDHIICKGRITQNFLFREQHTEGRNEEVSMISLILVF